MICPKCKNQIPEKSLKCQHCGTKIATLCKKCNSYNLINKLKCANCGNELLKLCPNCKSVNLPKAVQCRKCGFDFTLKSGDISKAPQQNINVVAQEQKDTPQKQNAEIQSNPQRQIELVPQSEQHKVENMPNLPVGEFTEQVSQDKIVEINENNISVTSSQDSIKISDNIVQKPQVSIPQNISEEPEIVENITPSQSSQEPQNAAFNQELLSQQAAKDLLKKAILSEAKVISVNGKNGVGKTIVMKIAIHELQQNNITWLVGECSNLTQLSPCGLIQDILISFFNIPNYCTDNLKLKKDSQRFFHSEFPSLSNEEIFNLLNFLYPTNAAYYENILANKDKTFALLQKVFQTIINHKETIFVIENFDFIDGMSYEFLYNIMNSPLINGQLKFLISYNDYRPGRGYLYNNSLKDEAYVDISLGSFDIEQSNALISTIVKLYFPQEDCPEKIKEEIFNISNGIPAVIEQYTNLLVDFRARNNTYEFVLPKTFDNVMKLRLKYLKENQVAYTILSLGAVQGMKFSHVLINQILQLEDQKFMEVLNLLQALNFVIPLSDNFYEFKNQSLWNSVIDFIKQDDNFIGVNTNLLAIYTEYKLSAYSILAVVSQNLNQNEKALQYWTDNIKIAAYIGDINLYAISQKQSLMLLDKLEIPNSDLIRNNIFERLGKLLSYSNPKEAMDYIPNAIVNAQNSQNILKEIELTGYLANCCNSLGNYFGTLECINSISKKIDSSFELELAMVKSRKLDALLNIGNCGEIVNLIDNEILPVFDKYINAKPHKNISIQSLYKAWLQTYLTLSNALAYQGNNRAFEVLDTLFEILKSNNFDNQLFICKAKLAKALASTIKGDIVTSETLLAELLKQYQEIMDTDAICKWNFINILNNFEQKKYDGLKEELYQVVTYANNYNDNWTKNILKTLLGKIFKDEENAKRALDIYAEQITYFSQERIAIGALLSWYLIAEAKLISEGPERSLEVSQKALEVSLNAKINNYMFIVLYNKIIAEAYMVLADYDAAKIHIEKAIMIANKFDLLYLQAQLYLLYGKYLQEIAITKTEDQLDYVTSAAKMFKKSLVIAQNIRNGYLIDLVEKEKTVLNSFCQLNNLVIKDN